MFDSRFVKFDYAANRFVANDGGHLVKVLIGFRADARMDEKGEAELSRLISAKNQTCGAAGQGLGLSLGNVVLKYKLIIWPYIADEETINRLQRNRIRKPVFKT